MSAATVAGLLADGARRLEAAGIGDGRREARVLLAEAMATDAAALVGHPEREVDAAARERFLRMVEQRALRKPMAQVLGRKGFWDHEFLVTADLLAPRPESETLIEAALDLFRGGPPHRILDLGVGTGCLLLTLLVEWPQAWGVGVDRSGEAVRIARSNAARLGCAGRAAFLLGDWGSPIDARFDLVIVNPPYISSSEIDGLEPEVARHEPRLALDGGADGLDAYRALLPHIARLLRTGGLALLEHGAGQGTRVAGLAREERLVAAGARSDLSGKERCLVLGTDTKKHLE